MVWLSFDFLLKNDSSTRRAARDAGIAPTPEHTRSINHPISEGGILVRFIIASLWSRYALVLDMITRTGHEMYVTSLVIHVSTTIDCTCWLIFCRRWPRYGTAPGYAQPGIGADGFQARFYTDSIVDHGLCLG